MPPALASRPVVDERIFFYLEVFNDLSTSRLTGESPQPIQFGAVMDYCTEAGISDRDTRLSYWRIIHACDMNLLAEYAEEAKKKLEALRKGSQ